MLGADAPTAWVGTGHDATVCPQVSYRAAERTLGFTPRNGLVGEQRCRGTRGASRWPAGRERTFFEVLLMSSNALRRRQWVNAGPISTSTNRALASLSALSCFAFSTNTSSSRSASDLAER